MTIEVTLKRNEPVERAMRRLKKILDNEGIMRELKERKYFQKPPESFQR